MRAVIQRVSRAQVFSGGEFLGGIDENVGGLLIYLGVGPNDIEKDADWLAERIFKLRVFSDEEGKMNKSLADLGGEVLVISQFTLFGSLKKGNRPSFNRAASPELGEFLYTYFLDVFSAHLGRLVASGRFGADMQVDSINDGPVTLFVDSKNRDI